MGSERKRGTFGLLKNMFPKKLEPLKAFSAPTEDIRWQASRAMLVSVVAAGVDVSLLVLFVQTVRWRPEPSAIASYLIGGLVNYLLCAKWVFPAAPKNAAVGFVFFTVLSLFGLCITWVCMHLLNGYWGLHYLVAKAVALAMTFCWNFLSRKFLLFRS
jgi:putative flippase GtrA